MTRDYKAGGRAAGMAEHAVAGPVVRARKIARARAYRHATFSQPSISAGTFKARKLIERGHGRHNPMIFEARRAYNIVLAHAKQPGRRYGPPPRSNSSGQGRSKQKVESS